MVKIVDDEAAGDADFVVCMRKVNDTIKLPDNLEGTCCRCEEVIVFRPHAPKKPPRICLECMVEEVGGVDELLKNVVTTERQMSEVRKKLSS